MQHFASAVGKRRRVKVETYPGFYHEVLNEKASSRVVADVLGWIERRLARRPQAAAGAEP